MNQMDKFFRDNLSNHQANVSDDSWSKIESVLDSRSKRRFGAFWMVGILFLIGVGSVVYVGITNDVFDSNTEKNSIAIKSYKTHNQVSVDSKDNKVKKTTTIDEIDLKTKKPIGNHSNSFSKSNLNQQNNSSLNTEKGKAVSVVDLKPSSEYSSHSGRQTAETPHLEEQILTNQHPNTTIQSEIDNPSESLNLNESNSNVAAIKLVNNNLEILENNVNFITPTNKIDCPDFSGKFGYVSVFLFHSSDLQWKHMKSTNQESQKYLDDRLNTERVLYSFSDGIHGAYVTRFGLFGGTGVEYTHIAEKFKYEDFDARKVKTVITFDTTFHSNGSYSTQSDTSRIEIEGVEIRNINNSYKMIDIPIFVGYRFSGKKIDVSLKAGATYNLLFQTKGQILDDKGEPKQIHTESSFGKQVFVNKLRMRYFGSISLDYHLNEYIDISVEPYFKSTTGNINLSTYPINQTYHTLGIRTGVKFNF